MLHFSDFLSNTYNSIASASDSVLEHSEAFALKTVSVAVMKKATEPYLVEYPADQVYAVPESKVASSTQGLPLRVKVAQGAVGFVAGQVTGAVVQAVVTKVAEYVAPTADPEAVKMIAHASNVLVFSAVAANLANRTLGIHKKQLQHDIKNIKRLPKVVKILKKQIESLDLQEKRLLQAKKSYTNMRKIDGQIESLRQDRERKRSVLEENQKTLTRTESKAKIFGFKRGT